MQQSKVTRGGQITLPAEVRRRWGAREVTVEDAGDHVVVRPAPDDAIASLRGLLKGELGMSSWELKEQARREELALEEEKERRHYGDRP